jgi:hypothetical protein
MDFERAADIDIIREKRRVESSVARCKTRSGRRSQSKIFTPSRAFASRHWPKLALRVQFANVVKESVAGSLETTVTETNATANKGRYRFGFTRSGAVAHCVERSFCNTDTSRAPLETRSQNNANAPFAGRLPGELEEVWLSYLPERHSHRFSYLAACTRHTVAYTKQKPYVYTKVGEDAVRAYAELARRQKQNPP